LQTANRFFSPLLMAAYKFFLPLIRVVFLTFSLRRLPAGKGPYNRGAGLSSSFLGRCLRRHPWPAFPLLRRSRAFLPQVFSFRQGCVISSLLSWSQRKPAVVHEHVSLSQALSSRVSPPNAPTKSHILFFALRSRILITPR